MGRRGIKEYRASEALALVAADREHLPLVCPSCGAAVERVPPRGAGRSAHASSERISLTCTKCGRHASYIEGPGDPQRDRTMDPKGA